MSSSTPNYYKKKKNKRELKREKKKKEQKAIERERTMSRVDPDWWVFFFWDFRRERKKNRNPISNQIWREKE